MRSIKAIFICLFSNRGRFPAPAGWLCALLSACFPKSLSKLCPILAQADPCSMSRSVRHNTINLGARPPAPSYPSPCRGLLPPWAGAKTFPPRLRRGTRTRNNLTHKRALLRGFLHHGKQTRGDTEQRESVKKERRDGGGSPRSSQEAGIQRWGGGCQLLAQPQA